MVRPVESFQRLKKVFDDDTFNICKVWYWATLVTWANFLCAIFRFSLIFSSVMFFTSSNLRSFKRLERNLSKRFTLPPDVMREPKSNVSSLNVFYKRQKISIDCILLQVKNWIIAFCLYRCSKKRFTFSLINITQTHTMGNYISLCSWRGIFLFLNSPNTILYVA